MKNVLVQFRRRYRILFCGRENLKNTNVRDTPILPFKIKILLNPVLTQLYTPIRTYPQNSMSLTLIVSAGRLYISQLGYPLLYI